MSHALVFLVAVGTASQQVALECEHIQSANGLYNLRGQKLPAFASHPNRAMGSEQIRAATRNKLTDKDTILLADFANDTGDEIFNGALEQPLRVALEESPFLSVLSGFTVAATLRDMAHPANAPLTPEVSRV